MCSRLPQSLTIQSFFLPVGSDVTPSLAKSELDAPPQSDHADRRVAAEPATQKSSRRHCRLANASETRKACLWTSSIRIEKIRMVEQIIELGIEPKADS